MDANYRRRKGHKRGRRRQRTVNPDLHHPPPDHTAASRERTEPQPGLPDIRATDRATAQIFVAAPAIASVQVANPPSREMFGPQARAAELQAMRSAAQRQRTREDSEPPEPAPVSLTDFARPLMSKNRGAKTFKPLSLTDLGEQVTGDESSDDKSEDNPIPLDGPGPAIIEGPPVAAPKPAFGFDSPLRFAPIAPRAMLSMASPLSGPVIYNRPVTVAHPLTQQVDPLSRPEMLAKEVSPAVARSHRDVPHTEAPPPPTRVSAIADVKNFLFGGDEYSPTKVELKATKLRQDLRDDAAMSYNRFKQLEMNTSVRVPMLPGPFGLPCPFDPHILSQYPFTSFEIPFHHLPTLDSFVPLNMACGFPVQKFQAARANTFFNDLVAHHNKPRVSATAAPFTPRQFVPVPMAIDQPYDRETKMQNFAAAQQAMARTGKTVLHNPNIQKPSEYDFPSLTPYTPNVAGERGGSGARRQPVLAGSTNAHAFEYHGTNEQGGTRFTPEKQINLKPYAYPHPGQEIHAFYAPYAYMSPGPGAAAPPDFVTFRNQDLQHTPTHSGHRGVHKPALGVSNLPNTTAQKSAPDAGNLPDAIVHRDFKQPTKTPTVEIGKTLPNEYTVYQKPVIRRKVEQCPAVMRALVERDKADSAKLRTPTGAERCERGSTLPPPPGLPIPEPYKAFPWPVDNAQYSSIRFPVDEKFGTDAWCEPVLLTEKEKELHKRVFRTVAAEMTTRDPTSFLDGRTVVTGDKVREWIHQSTNNQAVRRQQLEEIVDKHIEGDWGKMMAVGIIGDQQNVGREAQANVGSIKAVANLMATVQQYAEEGRKPEGRKRFVPVPEYAIDREAVQAYTTSRKSFFDREPTGPPVRAANNSRYKGILW